MVTVGMTGLVPHRAASVERLVHAQLDTEKTELLMEPHSTNFAGSDADAAGPRLGVTQPLVKPENARWHP
jgi:hypothetical protein